MRESSGWKAQGFAKGIATKVRLFVLANVRCTQTGATYRHDVMESDGGLAALVSLLQSTGFS